MTTKSVTRGVAGWLFGLSVTVLLISVWGRAVVVDTDALGESLSPMSKSVVVSDRFADWMVEGLSESGVEPSVANHAIAELLTTSAVASAFDELVIEVVKAAATVDLGPAQVDVAAVFQPAVPDIAQTLASTGVPVTSDEVHRMVSSLEPIVIREEGARPLIGPGSPMAARLGVAAVLALVTAVATGGAAVAYAPDRIAEVRSLLMRVSLGGVTFAILLRVGSWVLDPGGGRAPVGEALSALAGSKWLAPMRVGVVAGLVAAAIWAVRRWLIPGAKSRSPAEVPTPLAEPQPSRTG